MVMRQKIRLFVDMFFFLAILTLVTMLSTKLQKNTRQVQENKSVITKNQEIIEQTLKEIKNHHEQYSNNLQKNEQILKEILQEIKNNLPKGD